MIYYLLLLLLLHTKTFDNKMQWLVRTIPELVESNVVPWNSRKASDNAVVIRWSNHRFFKIKKLSWRKENYFSSQKYYLKTLQLTK